eukprot:scpid80042/ scgid13692/ 
MKTLKGLTKSGLKPNKCTDAIRIVIICGTVLSAALHMAVIREPNWWHFDYGYWVQDTTGVTRLNGGLFQVCQYQRSPITTGWTCAGIGEGPEGLLDTRDGLHPESNLLPLWRGFTVGALLPGLPVIILLAFAFRTRFRLILTKIAFGCLLAQSLLMVGGVGAAHEYIVRASCKDCDWRELYTYMWCFYAGCALIGAYMVLALVAMASFFLDRSDIKRNREDEYSINDATSDRTQTDMAQADV